MSRAGEVVTGWRSLQDDPCTCSPGDGTEVCERFDECFEAYCRYMNGERRVS